MCEVANVSRTVTSHVRHRPLAHGPWNQRYAVWTFSVWSKEAGWFFSWLNPCLVQCTLYSIVQKTTLHVYQRCVDSWGHADPWHQLEYHNYTATRMVSLDIRKPMDAMSGALSQSPECAAFEAKIRALTIWYVQLAKSMLKDCSVIFLSQNFCLS